MDAGELLPGRKELVALHVPGHMAGLGHDLHRIRGCDKSLRILFEVPRVGEGQFGLRLLQHLDRVLRRWIALGVEVIGLRVDLNCESNNHQRGERYSYPSTH